MTFAAGIVLIVTPASIPKTMGIQLTPDAYLLSYFLGAAELSIAYLSFFSRDLTNKDAIKIILYAFIVFHLSTGGLEVFAFFQGVDVKIIINVILRIVISALFYFLGIRNDRKSNQHKLNKSVTLWEQKF